MHILRTLTPINIQRIKATPKNGGSWQDWDESLVLKCHKKPTGRNYGSVYSKMKWDEPDPTMITFCIGIGNGRFGRLLSAVLSEIVANSWDAYATKVRMNIDGTNKVEIIDNGLI